MEYTDSAYILPATDDGKSSNKEGVGPPAFSLTRETRGEPSMLLEKTTYPILLDLSHGFAVPTFAFCATCSVISSAPRRLAVLPLKSPTKVGRVSARF